MSLTTSYHVPPTVCMRAWPLEEIGECVVMAMSGRCGHSASELEKTREGLELSTIHMA